MKGPMTRVNVSYHGAVHSEEEGFIATDRTVRYLALCYTLNFFPVLN